MLTHIASERRSLMEALAAKVELVLIRPFSTACDAECRLRSFELSWRRRLTPGQSVALYDLPHAAADFQFGLESAVWLQREHPPANIA